MKKINLWLMALLTLVTFGIYSIFWAARQRKLILEKHKELKIPHWSWLLVTYIASMVLFVPFLIVLVLIGTFADIAASQFAWMFVIAIYAYAFIPLAIVAWWSYRFGQAMEVVNGGRITAGWTLALYIFTGSFAALFHQYYINHDHVKYSLKAPKRVKPGDKFIIVATIVMIIGGLFYISSFATIPNDIRDIEGSVTELKQSLKKELKASEQYINEVNRLTKEYADCTAQLEKDYPGSLTLENEKAYYEAYDKCEAIRVQQETVINSTTN